MARRWYLLTLIPVVLLLAIARVQAVYLQPRLTMAGNASQFAKIVTESGGAAGVRRAFYLDVLFIVVFMAIVTGVLLVDHRWWWAPVAAGTLDLAENALSLVLLQASAPDFWFRVLWVVAAAKLLAYALSAGEVFCGVRRASQREVGRDRPSGASLQDTVGEPNT